MRQFDSHFKKFPYSHVSVHICTFAFHLSMERNHENVNQNQNCSHTLPMVYCRQHWGISCCASYPSRSQANSSACWTACVQHEAILCKDVHTFWCAFWCTHLLPIMIPEHTNFHRTLEYKVQKCGLPNVPIAPLIWPSRIVFLNFVHSGSYFCVYLSFAYDCTSMQLYHNKDGQLLCSIPHKRNYFSPLLRLTRSVNAATY